MPQHPVIQNSLQDASLLYQRAQRHLEEFRKLDDASEGGLWRIETGRDGVTGEHLCSLILKSEILCAMKPVIGDIANNLIHALDQVAAVASRSKEPERTRVYYPIAADDVSYLKEVKNVAKWIDPAWLATFAALRERHKTWMPHLALLKQVSNTSKHWELVAGDASAAAVAWNIVGQRQRIVDIPRGHFQDHDRFEFWREAEAIGNIPIQIITQHRFSGFGDNAAAVSTIFETASRFVGEVIEESRTMPLNA